VRFEAFADVGLDDSRVYGTSARAAFAQSMSFCTLGAPLTPIAPTISPSTLMGNPPPHAATRGSVGMPAKSDGFALDKVEKLLRDAEQSCVRLIPRNLDGRDRGPIHPAKSLEDAGIIGNRYVLGNANFSGFGHRSICHFPCQFARNAVFFHRVRHWIPSSIQYVLLLIILRFVQSRRLSLSCRIT
jgi:hypothetical protein